MRIAIIDPDFHFPEFLDYLHAQEPNIEISTYKAGEGLERHDIALVASSAWNYHSAIKLLEAKNSGLPSIEIIDGVRKWGRVWEDREIQSELVGVPLHQPVLADKIICMGPSQGRLLCSWGQYTKVEVAGLPRFDKHIHYHHARKRGEYINGSVESPNCLTIVLANKPGYSIDELEGARKALHDLNKHLQSCPEATSFDIVWCIGPRTPDCLPQDPVGRVSTNNDNLLSLLLNSSHVVSMPSTATLESMCLDIPTCSLSYSSLPDLIQTAWTVKSNSMMKRELRSLFAKDEARMMYQRYLLHDQMRVDTPASNRVYRLMKEMIAINQKSLSQSRKSVYPASMVPGRYDCNLAPYDYSPEKLFPAHPLFRRTDTDEMASEIANLRMYCRSLEQELSMKRFQSKVINKIKSAVRRVI